MNSTLPSLLSNALCDIESASTLLLLEEIKSKFLGKKGELTLLSKTIATLDPSQKAAFGQEINHFKTSFASAYDAKKAYLENTHINELLSRDMSDVTLPALGAPLGHSHPISQTLTEIIDIFSTLGFSLAYGPDIELDHYNFEKLNIPAHHPSRDMHDTFYFSKDLLLRTHTSPVQIRSMMSQTPPLRLLAPGKVYRCDSDATHSAMFHQLEGLCVEDGISFADLKGILSFFLQRLFGSEKKVRFRPSYFPFTEPSTEVDVQCVMCDGSGCRLCKHSGWLEILGAGMVHPAVFKEVGYNPDTCTGFAFGLGIDRIAMLKYKIDDIRLLYENDSRFLNQF